MYFINLKQMLVNSELCASPFSLGHRLRELLLLYAHVRKWSIQTRAFLSDQVHRPVTVLTGSENKSMQSDLHNELNEARGL